MALDEPTTRVFVHQIVGIEVAFRARLFNHLLRVLGIGLLLRQVGDGYAGRALTSEHNGGGASETAVSARNDGSLALQSGGHGRVRSFTK